MKLVERLDQDLLNARTAGRMPSTSERERLLRLRAEIDHWLTSGSPD